MKILLGFRRTKHGSAALDAAVYEAGRRDAELIIFQHVPILSSEQRGTETPRVLDTLNKLETQLNSEGIRCRTSWSVGGSSAAHALLKAAQEEDADLIIIGIRRRSAVGKLILGSNAHDILLNADVPVLAVKADEP